MKGAGSMGPAAFVRDVLGRDPEVLSRHGISIKFIFTAAGVLFDPQLYRAFTEAGGEGDFYHRDIACHHGLRDGQVLGGASLRVERDRVVITGSSRQYGGLDGYEREASAFFAARFSCPVLVETG